MRELYLLSWLDMRNLQYIGWNTAGPEYRPLTGAAGCDPLSPEFFGHEWQALFAPEAVRAVEGFLLCFRTSAEHVVNLFDLIKALNAGGDGEDRIFLAGFGKEGAGRDEPGHVVHFGPVQDARNV